MALPALYTDSTFKDYLITVLGECGSVLGWDSAEPVLDEVVNDTLITYGAADLSACDDIPKLRIIGKWQVWKAAVDALAGYYTVALPESGGTLTRSQVYAQAGRRLQAAEIAAGPYGSGYRVTVTTVRRQCWRSEL